MDQPRRLFDDYRYYRQHTASVQTLKQQKPYLREMKATLERLKLFGSMAAWCADQGINPRLWLYSLFVSRKWLFAPKLESAHLQSQKHIPKYHALEDTGLYKQRQMEQESLTNVSNPTTFDPNRSLSHASEEAKRAYLAAGNPQACMAATSTETFGFHPGSTVCARCPVVEPCKAQLQALVRFDIQALRRGEITSEQARQQALDRVQSYPIRDLNHPMKDLNHRVKH